MNIRDLAAPTVFCVSTCGLVFGSGSDPSVTAWQICMAAASSASMLYDLSQKCLKNKAVHPVSSHEETPVRTAAQSVLSLNSSRKSKTKNSYKNLFVPEDFAGQMPSRVVAKSQRSVDYTHNTREFFLTSTESEIQNQQDATRKRVANSISA